MRVKFLLDLVEVGKGSVRGRVFRTVLFELPDTLVCSSLLGFGEGANVMFPPGRLVSLTVALVVAFELLASSGSTVGDLSVDFCGTVCDSVSLFSGVVEECRGSSVFKIVRNSAPFSSVAFLSPDGVPCSEGTASSVLKSLVVTETDDAVRLLADEEMLCELLVCCEKEELVVKEKVVAVFDVWVVFSLAPIDRSVLVCALVESTVL